MLDQPAASHRPRLHDGPRLDFQDHLADLEAKGLLVRIDRAINKDTELHPLVRWQFLGGVPEDKRRAFLFTHVTDAKGRRYDIPVVVGALAASPEIYAIGMGQPVDAIGEAWMRAIADPIAPVAVSAPRCQEVVLTGDDLKAPGGLGEPAGADLDARLRFRALSDRHALRHPRSRYRHPEHGHVSGCLESVGPAGRAHGGARGERGRRLSALAQIPRAARADADRDRDRLRARGHVHRVRRSLPSTSTSLASPARSPARRSKWRRR